MGYEPSFLTSFFSASVLFGRESSSILPVNKVGLGMNLAPELTAEKAHVCTGLEPNEVIQREEVIRSDQDDQIDKGNSWIYGICHADQTFHLQGVSHWAAGHLTTFSFFPCPTARSGFDFTRISLGCLVSISLWRQDDTKQPTGFTSQMSG
jgi:hypothetical protein